MAGMESDPVVAVEAFHEEVDRVAAEIAALHGERIRCARGCADCCVDGLTVLTVEAELIRRHHGDLLRSADPYPLGACVFLNRDGACRIYPHRPYVCRTQGLPLSWVEETGGGQLVEMRDICPLNEPGGPPVEELPEEACWRIGPWEGRLARLQYAFAGRLERVRLRDLFRPEGEVEVLPCRDW